LRPLLIVDEKLPLELVDYFGEYLPTSHVNNLKRHSKQKISDDQLRSLSLKRKCIIITKDDDFVRSWVSRKVPEKVVFVHYDGRKSPLLSLLKEYCEIISALVDSHDFIEVSDKGLRLPFDTPLPYQKDIKKAGDP
jgi:predicted nuclease of predicted toxin-antitoxin system